MVWAPDLQPTCNTSESSSSWGKSQSILYSQKLSSFRNQKYESKKRIRPRLKRRNSHISTSALSETSIAASVRSRTNRMSAIAKIKDFESSQLHLSRTKPQGHSKLRNIVNALRDSKMPAIEQMR